VDRALDLYGLVIIGLLAVAGDLDCVVRNPEYGSLAAASWVCFLVGRSGVFLALSSSERRAIIRSCSLSGTRPGEWLDRLTHAFAIYRFKPTVMIAAVGNDVLGQALYVAILSSLGVMVASSTGQFLGFWQTLLVAPLALLANALPIFPNGIGVGEVVS
jgi:hypothetical protein